MAAAPTWQSLDHQPARKRKAAEAASDAAVIENLKCKRLRDPDRAVLASSTQVQQAASPGDMQDVELTSHTEPHCSSNASHQATPSSMDDVNAVPAVQQTCSGASPSALHGQPSEPENAPMVLHKQSSPPGPRKAPPIIRIVMSNALPQPSCFAGPQMSHQAAKGFSLEPGSATGIQRGVTITTADNFAGPIMTTSWPPKAHAMYTHAVSSPSNRCQSSTDDSTSSGNDEDDESTSGG
ncbi:hypothetical protein WJX73_006962 [Symbiochloris irregularis]|uniref:Uncharacterized protein n=1 Tax=Symbiochloris irregularis TaxID=706552 RepID=A0AAW1NNK1_9CHLO